MIQFVESVKIIEQQYRTGEEPVLVMCSDKKNYVCKYMRTSSAAYKLSCELIGSMMAMAWELPTPQVAFVNIKQSHWSGKTLSHSLSAPAFGSQFVEKVGDISVILEEMPEQWHFSTAVVKEKLNQLFDTSWTTGVWNNYMECLKENL